MFQIVILECHRAMTLTLFKMFLSPSLSDISFWMFSVRSPPSKTELTFLKRSKSHEEAKSTEKVNDKLQTVSR